MFNDRALQSTSSSVVQQDAIVQHMQLVCTEDCQNFLNKSVTKYLEKTGMVNNNVWATNAEILGAAFFKFDVVVFGNYENHFKWLRYPVAFNLDRKLCIVLMECL